MPPTQRWQRRQTTALVEPHAFTTGLMHAAQAHGAVLRHGTVVDLVRNPSGAVRGVALASGEIVEGDVVVIAMGPWSILAARWLPLPAVLGYKGHSLVFEQAVRHALSAASGSRGPVSTLRGLVMIVPRRGKGCSPPGITAQPQGDGGTKALSGFLVFIIGSFLVGR